MPVLYPASAPAVPWSVLTTPSRVAAFSQRKNSLTGDLPNDESASTHVSPKCLALVTVVLFVRTDADT